MIFAPRSCPSSPGLATTTRILRVEVASMRRRILRRRPRRAPRLWSADLERHRHVRRVHRADDLVGPALAHLLLVLAGALQRRREVLRAALDVHVVERV